jgi:hypothetical protein
VCLVHQGSPCERLYSYGYISPAGQLSDPSFGGKHSLNSFFTDRELHHINPKGRPVKQCEHCRGARKSKSHHAKCDCGDKKDKDKSKDKGDAKGESTADVVSVEGVLSNHAAVGSSGCQCHAGAKCLCGVQVKKEPSALKLDTGKHVAHAARAKPKLNTAHSESTLTVFANGHHKPCHRNNNSAHVSGAPYKIPRPHTLHGPTAFASYSQDSLQRLQCPSESAAPRSIDTLSLPNDTFYGLFGSGQNSDSLPVTPVTGALDSATLQDSLFSGPSSSVFANDGSSAPENPLDNQLREAAWWAPATSSQFGLGSLSTSPSQDCLTNYESDWAIPSAGLENPIWSATDLPLDPNKLNDTFAQPISQSGESNHHSAPGLTTGSSAQSEVGESTLFGELEFRNPPSNVGETLFWEDNAAFRLANPASSDVRPAPASITTTSERPPLELDFYDRMTKSNMANSDMSYSSSLGFRNTGADEAQVAKEVTGATNKGTNASPSNTSAAYTSPDYSEPQAVSIPSNNLDDGVSSAWIALDNSAYGAPSLDQALDGGFDLSNFNAWI